MIYTYIYPTGWVNEASGVGENKEHKWMIYIYTYPTGWVNEILRVGGRNGYIQIDKETYLYVARKQMT